MDGTEKNSGQWTVYAARETLSVDQRHKTMEPEQPATRMPVGNATDIAKRALDDEHATDINPGTTHANVKVKHATSRPPCNAGETDQGAAEQGQNARDNVQQERHGAKKKNSVLIGASVSIEAS